MQAQKKTILKFQENQPYIWSFLLKFCFAELSGRLSNRVSVCQKLKRNIRRLLHVCDPFIKYKIE